jgi:pyruvate dehydrogenase E1 component alpha subunit
VDGQDVLAVQAAAQRLVDRARKGEGPSFLMCNTYRYTGHHVGDISREYYRSKQEEQTWKGERDPILNFAAWLKSEKIADIPALQKIETELEVEMDAAVQFAIAAPYPGVEEVEQHVYAVK